MPNTDIKKGFFETPAMKKAIKFASEESTKEQVKVLRKAGFKFPSPTKEISCGKECKWLKLCHEMNDEILRLKSPCKRIEAIPLIKDKNGKLIWKAEGITNIRDGIFATEAAILLLAEKLNEVISYLNSK